ncbi:MAG TPA: hypothetical protein VKY26_07160 [Actinomycetota bacterium]|nr:hypothetical protein [Actinomycetota bacterium]
MSAAQVEAGAVHGIDRLLRNIETGRFERMLSGLTAGAALVNGLEIFLEHDRASFGNRWMWAPIALTPPMIAAGVVGVAWRRAAKTVLPIVSAFVLANGIQGTYLHARGILRRPGGLSEAVYNVETGPPPFAPLLMGMVGGMGLLAAILRRER